MLLTTRCLPTTHSSRLTTYQSLLTVTTHTHFPPHCPLLTPHCPLPTTHCPLATAHYAPPTRHCPRLTTCYSPCAILALLARRQSYMYKSLTFRTHSSCSSVPLGAWLEVRGRGRGQGLGVGVRG